MESLASQTHSYRRLPLALRLQKGAQIKTMAPLID
jgi:hypothetical protein